MQRIFATVGGVKNVSGMSVGELAKLKEMGKSALPRLQKTNPSLYIDLDTALRDPKTPKAELQNLLKLAGESSDDVYGKIPKSELVKPMDSIVKSQSDDLLKEAKKYKTADDFVNSFKMENPDYVDSSVIQNHKLLNNTVHTVPLDDISQFQRNAASSAARYRTSATKVDVSGSPVTLRVERDGSISIADGNHRIAQAMRNGDNSVTAIFEGEVPTKYGKGLTLTEIWNKANK
jgi:hypothetical protein